MLDAAFNGFNFFFVIDQNKLEHLSLACLSRLLYSPSLPMWSTPLSLPGPGLGSWPYSQILNKACRGQTLWLIRPLH
jgi:hypothetical protein